MLHIFYIFSEWCSPWYSNSTWGASGKGGSTFKTISLQNGEHVAKDSQWNETAKKAESSQMFSLSCRFDYKTMQPKGIFSSEMYNVYQMSFIKEAIVFTKWYLTLQIISHYMVVNNAAPRSSGKTLIATKFVFLLPKEWLSLSISQNKHLLPNIVIYCPFPCTPFIQIPVFVVS